jgi:hypothetical protein
MNDPETLAVYTQLVVFRGNGSMSELIIRDPDHPKQNILCNLAHSLDLEYEYDLNLKKARISRGPQVDHDSLDRYVFKTAFPSPRAASSIHTRSIGTPVPVINQSYLFTDCVDDSLEEEVNPDEMADRPMSLLKRIELGPTCMETLDRFDRLLDNEIRLGLSTYARNDTASIKSFSSRGSTSGSASSSIHSSRSNRSFNSARGGYFSSFKAGSEAPSSSRRRGPLPDAARAAARAVKSVKACWRCKILRKKVSYRFNWIF